MAWQTASPLTAMKNIDFADYAVFLEKIA